MDVRYPSDAEWAVVSILADGKAIDKRDVLQRIDGEDFANLDVACIYKAETAMMARREQPMLDTVSIELAKLYGQDEADRIMMTFMTRWTEFHRNGFALAQYVDAIAEASQRRRLDALADEMKTAAQDASTDVSAYIDNVRSSMRKMSRDDGKQVSGADAVIAAYEAAERREKPIPTGFAELDEVMCGGLMKPELTIVGARPGKGKSAFLLAVASNAAMNNKHTAYISLEMSEIQIGQRVLASASEVSVSRQRFGADVLTDKDWEKLAAGVEWVGNQGIGQFLHIYTAPGLSVERLSAIAQNAVDRGELDLLVVDYLQLLKSTQKTRSDFERLGIVSKTLKELALALDIPILTAAQVRRQDNFGGAQRAPGLSELRGSGDMEQDADNVLLIHSPETPDDESLKRLPKKHEYIYDRATVAGFLPFSIDVAKQRQGANMRTWCLFKPSTMRFIEDKYEVMT